MCSYCQCICKPASGGCVCVLQCFGQNNIWPKVKAKENKKKKQHEQQQHTHTTTSTRSVGVTNSTQWNCMESVCVCSSESERRVLYVAQQCLLYVRAAVD